jgi:predicted membrane protein
MIGSFLTVRWAHRNRGMAGNGIVSAAAFIGTVAGALVLLRSVLRHILSVNAVLALMGATAIRLVDALALRRVRRPVGHAKG